MEWVVDLLNDKSHSAGNSIPQLDGKGFSKFTVTSDANHFDFWVKNDVPIFPAIGLVVGETDMDAVRGPWL